jgi:hypothetical protein
MSVALSIAFTGLCALVADGDRAPAEVLLLDAKGIGEVAGVMLPEHTPTLVASLRDVANADTSNPTRVIVAWQDRGAAGIGAIQDRAASPAPGVDQVGLWDLTGSEIRIRVQGAAGTGLQLFQPTTGETSWPEAPRNANDPRSWRDLRFVANMKTIVGDGRIDPALTHSDDVADRLPRAVAARILLDAGLLEGGIPSQDVHRSDSFEFRSAGSGRTLRQALTDTVSWSLTSDAAAVVIEIVPVSGGPIKRLLLAPSATPHHLFVSNLPTENEPHGNAHHAMTDEEMGAVHFGAYYKLLLNEPADKPVPQPWRPHERRGLGFIRPVLCPPAIFSRP